MPVLRSMWCGRRYSPVCLSSTTAGMLSAWCERRMSRREGLTFFFGTAIVMILVSAHDDAEPGARAHWCRADRPRPPGGQPRPAAAGTSDRGAAIVPHAGPEHGLDAPAAPAYMALPASRRR